MKVREIAELAKRMKNFEKEIICESKDVTIKAFWEPESDGSGVYVVDYYKGETESEANILNYLGRHLEEKWEYDDTHKEEHPKMFQSILLKLIEMLNKEETEKKTKKEMQKEEIQENVNYIRLLIDGVKASLFPIDWYFDYIWGNITPSDSEPLMCCLEKIEDLEKLCNELKIDVPHTPEVFLREDIYVIKYEGKYLQYCVKIKDVKTFLQGWILSCVNNVFKEAERKIKLLLS